MLFALLAESAAAFHATARPGVRGRAGFGLFADSGVSAPPVAASPAKRGVLRGLSEGDVAAVEEASSPWLRAGESAFGESTFSGEPRKERCRLVVDWRTENWPEGAKPSSILHSPRMPILSSSSQTSKIV